MLQRTIIAGLVMVLFVVASSQAAPSYPAKPIEINCPYSAGSSFDVLARVIADLVPKYLGQPAVVVNKVGAAGALAAADVLTSPPDGYKIALLTTVFFSTATKMQRIPFSPGDLVPIANFSEQKIALVVKGDSPHKTLNDLLTYGKAHRGQLKWCHPGRGTISHTNGLILFRKAGIEAIDVPYKGGPELLSAVLGGHVDASIITVGMLRDQVKAGKIRPLMFLSEERYPDYPEVPSAPEMGFGEAARVRVLLGLYVHKNTPENIKKLLAETSKKIYDDPAFKKRVEELGDQPRMGNADFIRASIKKEEEINVPILKEFGLYVGK